MRRAPPRSYRRATDARKRPHIRARTTDANFRGGASILKRASTTWSVRALRGQPSICWQMLLRHPAGKGSAAGRGARPVSSRLPRLPCDHAREMDLALASSAAQERAALVIFAATYAVLGFGSLPPLRIDRTGATLIGATAMVGFGVLTPQQAVAAI